MSAEKDILICVKTYPEYSTKYTETVCTAGILKETKQLIRLYPITYRYLEGDRKFGKYQWITAEIQKNPADRRPESYKVNLNSIQLGDRIDSSNNWNQRKHWVLSEKNIYPSLDALLKAQEVRGTSLGLITIKKMINFEIRSKTKDEIEEAESKKDRIMKQLNFFEARKDLELIPFRFSLRFSCDDGACQGPHKVSVLDWEFGQLYRRLKGTNNWRDLIQERIREILSPERDTYLFMGNMLSHPKAFSVLGFFWPKKDPQFKLF
jgi:hypothetical protein